MFSAENGVQNALFLNKNARNIQLQNCLLSIGDTSFKCILTSLCALNIMKVKKKTPKHNINVKACKNIFITENSMNSVNYSFTRRNEKFHIHYV